MFLWACDRYRADIRMVWEKCVAIMSNDDVDEGKQQPGFSLLLCLLCPSSSPDGVNVDDDSRLQRQFSVKGQIGKSKVAPKIIWHIFTDEC